MSRVLEGLLSVPPLAAYSVITLLVFGEAAFFLGFVLPGETAVLLGGALASRHTLSLPVLMVLVVVAAIVGDSVGYEVGRLLGPRVLRLRWLARHEERLAGAQDFLRRRGAPAVFLGRGTAFLRAVVPGLAGLSRMPYPRFLAWNALGGMVWGVGVTLLGYAAGTSYTKVEKTLGRGGAVVALALLVAALVAWHRSRRRARAR